VFTVGTWVDGPLSATGPRQTGRIRSMPVIDGNGRGVHDLRHPRRQGATLHRVSEQGATVVARALLRRDRLTTASATWCRPPSQIPA
jgi:hypothetical protein